MKTEYEKASADSPLQRQSWKNRRLTGSSEMLEWTEAEWRSWWKDGLDIFCSDNIGADRHFAFAPFYFMSHQWDELRSTNADYLIEEIKKLFLRNNNQNLHVFREAFMDVTLDAECMNSASKSEVILSVCESILLQDLKQVIVNILDAQNMGWFETDEDHSDLLSKIGYCIRDHIDVDPTDELSEKIMPYLLKCENFHTVMSYCLKAFSDPYECVNRIYAIGRFEYKDAPEIRDDIVEDVIKKFRIKDKRGIKAYAAALAVTFSGISMPSPSV